MYTLNNSFNKTQYQIYQYARLPSWNQTSSPIGVASDRVPPLVLIDVDALHICLCVNVICAAGQSLEEASSIAPSVNPGCVVIADAPHDAKTVTLHHTQVTTHLPPKPEQMRKRYLLLKKFKTDGFFYFRQLTRGCSYIWSQGVGYGMASRAGDGSLTKMSPLHVIDQMACLEGGP